MKHGNVLVLAVLSSSLLLAASGLAQNQTESTLPDDVYVERLAVDIVNVEVYVTDRQGEPVMDLERDDFEVSEDGNPVEVVNFYRVVGGRPSAESEEPATGDAPVEVSQERDPPPLRSSAPEVPEEQRLHVVVYVDNFHIHPLNRNRVFRRLREFLAKTISSDDRVMVATYDRSLQIRHGFTSDPRLVNDTLREIETLSGNGNIREAERSAALQKIYEARAVAEARNEAKRFAEAAEFELGKALEGLDELVESLAGIPGRKMFLHVSDGLPLTPGRDLYQAVQQRFADISSLGEAASRDMSQVFMRTISNANSNRISFYTIDAAGLRVQSGMGAENQAISSNHVVNTAIDAAKRSNLQGSLRLMAARTGGQTILNTNDIESGLENVARDFGNYYSLGYRAPIRDRGRYHQIEVRLREGSKDLRLRHREGYRDKTPDRHVQDALQAFLMHGYERNPLDVGFDIGQQSDSDDGYVDVPIRVSVPLQNLTLLPLGDSYVGRLRFYFGAVDEKGRDAGGEELPFELRIPASSIEVARKDEVSRIINAKMRKGPHRLVVAVRDEVSEERSVVGRYVDVGGR